MPIDLHAPIIPGASAAGLLVGADADEQIADCRALFEIEDAPDSWRPKSLPQIESKRYRSPSVDFWTEDGKIRQIGLHDGYHGKFNDAIGVGSTLGDARDLVGPLVLDEFNGIGFAGIPGLFLETDCSSESHDVFEDRITWIHAYLDKVSASQRHMFEEPFPMRPTV